MNLWAGEKEKLESIKNEEKINLVSVVVAVAATEQIKEELVNVGNDKVFKL